MGMLKRKDLPMGEEFNTLVEAIDQLPTPVLQKGRFSQEKNRFLAIVQIIWTFLETAVTLDRRIVLFFFTSSYGLELLF